MRKLKLQVQLTVDGFIAGTNGEMDWMVWNWDDALKNYVGDITEPVDTILLGRKLAEGFIPHWAANPAQEGADKMNSCRKIVFTKTLNHAAWQHTELAKGDLEEEVKNLKQSTGGDMIAYGGSTFVSALIKAGLIDEYHLFINPVAIGKGMPIFTDLQDKLYLTLEKSTAFDCGITVLKYTPRQSQ